jgi:hypothetical protein
MVSAVALCGACLGIGCAVAHATRLRVQVPAHASPQGDVAVSFRPPGHLPRGGYYYAVVVLVRYAGYSAGAPPPCATSSDMQSTAYGYPHPRRRVTLTLIQAASSAHRWCAGGVYEGAIYAVPHRPPCSRAYPCSGRSTGYGPCWEAEGRVLCGVVAKPEPPAPKPEPPAPKPEPPATKGEPPSYSYPGGLPKPIDRSARVIGRFQLRF